MARRKAQPELRPIYMRPTLDPRQRAAKRAFCNAAYSGDRYRPKAGEFDPLWLRLGLRMQMIESRAGWVVNNPQFDQSLRRNPLHDPSLPGVGWLREIYRSHRATGLVTLPGVRGQIERRIAALRATEMVCAPPAPEQPSSARQASLFSAEEDEQELADRDDWMAGADLDDDPFCACSAEHGIEELDSNQCDCCGRDMS